MSESTSQLKIGAALDGSFEQTTTTVKRKIGELGAAATSTGKSLAGMGDGTAQSAQKVEQATKSIIQGIQRTTAATEAGVKGSVEYYKALANQRGIDANVLKPYLDQLDAVKAKQAQATAALLSGSQSIDKIGISAKQTAAAMRGVPAQFTDIITSLQGGQAPLTVFLQQGGQLKDMFGGAGNAARALGGYVAGIISPLSIAAAGVAAVGLAFYKGSREALEYGKAIILSGNASGTTAAQLQEYAQAISKISGTQGNAAAAITQFVTAGKVGVDNLEAFTLSAVKFEKATGTAIKDTVQQFADLAKSPVEASVKLNEQYGYLTTAVYKQIKALEDQGKATEAADLAQKTFSDTLAYRASAIVNNIGLIEKGWLAVKSAITGAADAALNVGRASTPTDRLGAVNSEIAKLQAPASRGGSAFDTGFGANDPRRAARLASLQAEAAVLQGIAISQAESAKSQAAQLDSTKANIEFDKIAGKFITDKAKIQKEITEATNVALRAGKSQLEIEKLIADIRLSHNKTGAAITGQTEVADIRARITAQKSYLQQLQENGSQALKQTEGDKLVKKITEELTTSITGLTRAGKVKALSAAMELAATDKLVESEKRRLDGLKKSEEAYASMLDKLRQDTNALGEKADQMEASNKVWGKGTVAIEKYKLALDNAKLAEAEGGSDSSYSTAYLIELRQKAANQQRVITQAQIADYKTLNEKALEYARTVAAEAIAYGDEAELAAMSTLERAKALAIRKVDLEVAKQIAEVERSGATQSDKEALQASINVTALRDKQTQVSKAIADDFVKMADTINSSLTDALLRGFESGKGFARNLRDTLVNMFKTLVLRPIISAVVNPVAGALTGALGLSGAAQAAGTGSSLLSGASTLASLSGALGAGLKAGFSGLIGEAGLMGTLSAGTTALGAGNIIGGIGTLAAPLALATAAILGLSAIIKATSGETRNGAAYGVGLDGMATKLQGPSGGEIASVQARAMFNVTKSSIEGMLTAFGSKAVLTGFTAGLESSTNGKGFAYSTGKINGVAFGDTNTFNNSRGDKSQEQALKDYQKELSQSILEALQVTADIPGTVAKLITDGLNGSAVKDLTLEATSAILLTVETLSKQVNTFNGAMMSLPFEQLKNLSFDTAAGLIAAAGGFEKLDANLGGFYQNFYTAEEQRAQLAKNTSKAFADLGLVMPKLDEGARAAYRAMVELAAGQDLSIEANAKAYTALLALQDPMSKLAPAVENVASSVAESIAKMNAAVQSAQSVSVQMGITTAYAVAQGAAQSAYDAALKAAPGLAGYTEREIVAYAADPSKRGELDAQTFGVIDSLVTAIGAWNAAQATEAQRIASLSNSGSTDSGVTVASTAYADTLKGITDQTADFLMQLANVGKDSYTVALAKITTDAAAKLKELDALGGAGAAVGPENSAARIVQVDAQTEAVRAYKRTFDSIAFARDVKAAQDAYDAAISSTSETISENTRIVNAWADAQTALLVAQKTEGERATLQDQLNKLTETAAEALTRQRNALVESNRPLFDQVQAQIALADAAPKAISAMKALSDEIDKVAAFKDSIGNAQQGIMSQMVGYDAVAYGQSQVSKYTGKLANATTTAGRIEAGTGLRDAITGRYDAELALISKNRDAASTAAQEAFNAQLEADNAAISSANELNGAYRQIGDYAKNLLTGANSPFNGAEQLKASSASYAQLLAGSQAGDKDALGNLTGAADSYLSQAKLQSTSSSDYARTFGRTINELSALGGKAGVDIESVQRTFMFDSTAFDKQSLDLQTSAIAELGTLAELTDVWTAELKDALGEQALAFVNIGLNTSQIVDYTSQIEPGFDRVVAALGDASKVKMDQEQLLEWIRRPGILTDGPGLTGGRDRVVIDQTPPPYVGVHRESAQKNSDALLIKIAELTEQVAKLTVVSQKTADNTKATADVLDSATGGGGPMLVQTA